ncbi:MAG: serine hydrolase domain-containing protein [Novosphingobium sp.]
MGKPAIPVDRRTLFRLAAQAGVAAALMPRLAWAASLDERFANVTALIDSLVTPRKLPGMVAALGENGGRVQAIARGTESFNDPDPVTLDSLYRLYSMTKPITGIAAMILIDDGKLGLDQPLAEILPKFARMQVQAVPDGSLTEVRPARTAITIRHLLTHTAGLGYAFGLKGALAKAMVERGLMAGRSGRVPLPGIDMGEAAPSLAAFADRLAELPLVYEPGMRWNYSVGLDLMGRVIEVVSGQPFDAFLAERIFAPCGMSSTWFQVPKAQSHRLTVNYGIVAGIPVAIDPGSEESVYCDPPPFPMGGAGLVGSPRDYDRFLAMLAGGGAIEGRRVLGEAAVRQATSNLLPAGAATKGTIIDGAGFGAGGRVGLGEQAGTFGWAGAAGTVGFVDMRRRLRAALYAQFMPSSVYSLERAFPPAIVADLRAQAGG